MITLETLDPMVAKIVEHLRGVTGLTAYEKYKAVERTEMLARTYYDELWGSPSRPAAKRARRRTKKNRSDRRA